MLTQNEFKELVERNNSKTLVLDGALATELESRGKTLNHPLWSGKILLEDPDSILDVHRDYFQAGAQVTITASYQASTQGLSTHLGLSEAEARAVISRSVELAQRARDEVRSDGTAVVTGDGLLVAGSVGPYGAFLADGSEYTGAYSLSNEEMKEFHRPRVAALINAGADLLAVETIPSLEEVKVILSLLEEEFPDAICWISCTVSTSSGGLEMSDGTPLLELASLVSRYENQVVAVGVNCVPPGVVLPALERLRQGTEMALVAYPNSGEEWDGQGKVWKKGEGSGGSEVAKSWRVKAQLIGGCCRTGPEDIKRMCEESTP